MFDDSVFRGVEYVVAELTDPDFSNCAFHDRGHTQHGRTRTRLRDLRRPPRRQSGTSRRAQELQDLELKTGGAKRLVSVAKASGGRRFRAKASAGAVASKRDAHEHVPPTSSNFQQLPVRTTSAVRWPAVASVEQVFPGWHRSGCSPTTRCPIAQILVQVFELRGPVAIPESRLTACARDPAHVRQLGVHVTGPSAQSFSSMSSGRLGPSETAGAIELNIRPNQIAKARTPRAQQIQRIGLRFATRMRKMGSMALSDDEPLSRALDKSVSNPAAHPTGLPVRTGAWNPAAYPFAFTPI